MHHEPFKAANCHSDFDLVTGENWRTFQKLLYHSGDGKLWMVEHLEVNASKSFAVAADLLNAMSRTIRDRRVFLCSAGAIGLASSNVEEGDIICVLFGSPTLCIVRPHESHIHLIGEAYYSHSAVMDGSAVDSGMVVIKDVELR